MGTPMQIDAMHYSFAWLIAHAVLWDKRGQRGPAVHRFEILGSRQPLVQAALNTRDAVRQVPRDFILREFVYKR